MIGSNKMSRDTPQFKNLAYKQKSENGHFCGVSPIKGEFFGRLDQEDAKRCGIEFSTNSHRKYKQYHSFLWLIMRFCLAHESLWRAAHASHDGEWYAHKKESSTVLTKTLL